MNIKYYFKIIQDERLDYLDLINTGNYGYHGSQKLMEKIQKLGQDTVFFVLRDEENSGKQTDQEVIHYILKNGTKIDENHLFLVYRFEE